MDPIDGASRAIKVLRQRMASNLSKQGATGRPASPDTPAVASAARESVRAAISTRLRALDAADPHFLERGVETFVEGVLLSEFGAELINDVQFRQVILGVVREMRAEPQTARQLETMILTLRRQR